jgi:hypothetical protein
MTTFDLSTLTFDLFTARHLLSGVLITFFLWGDGENRQRRLGDQPRSRQWGAAMLTSDKLQNRLLVALRPADYALLMPSLRRRMSIAIAGTFR